MNSNGIETPMAKVVGRSIAGYARAGSESPIDDYKRLQRAFDERTHDTLEKFWTPENYWQMEE